MNRNILLKDKNKINKLDLIKNNFREFREKGEIYNGKMDAKIEYNKECNSKEKNHIVKFTFIICVISAISGILLIIGGVIKWNQQKKYWKA